MTVPHHKPDDWANEQESARFCSRSYEWFRNNRKTLEAVGFPKRDPIIKKRPVHLIKAFLGLSNPAEISSAPEGQQRVRDWG
jgi:hypothetical protein